MAPLGLTLWEKACQMIPNISRRQKKVVGKRENVKKIIKKMLNQKIDKLPVLEELWIFGRNRQMRLER